MVHALVQRLGPCGRAPGHLQRFPIPGSAVGPDPNIPTVQTCWAKPVCRGPNATTRRGFFGTDVEEIFRRSTRAPILRHQWRKLEHRVGRPFCGPLAHHLPRVPEVGVLLVRLCGDAFSRTHVFILLFTPGTRRVTGWERAGVPCVGGVSASSS